MDSEAIKHKKQAIIDHYGEWTDHNIHLGGNVYTISETHRERKLERIVQIVADTVACPLSSLRVLDLACLEGIYAIEFARHGAQCVALEGRQANLEKARFAKETLGLENLHLHLGDVRNLSVDTFGYFDVVICSGILYHLDAPDVFEFIEHIANVCRRVAVFDTNINMAAKQQWVFKGRPYWGNAYVEHAQESTQDEKLANLWGSLDNVQSVWLTRYSLLNLLSDVGFTSVFECQNPPLVGRMDDRVTFLAVKGTRVALQCQPAVSSLPYDRWPERKRLTYSENQRVLYPVSQFIARVLPVPLKRLLRYIIHLVSGQRRNQNGGPPWAWTRPWQHRQEKDDTGDHGV